MMARIETEAARRAMRLKFYKDDVFVIAHKAIKEMPCSVGLEDLFCSAERSLAVLFQKGLENGLQKNLNAL